MNQHHRGRVFVAGFLVVNANAIYIDETRVFRMENNVATLLPIGVTRP